MRRALRLTKALYPAMGVVMVCAFLFSYREPSHSPLSDTPLVRERVFPFIDYAHGAGVGTFFPGSFALNFFGPSLTLMLALNLLLGDRARPLLPGRANVFTYLFVLLVAIGEIGTDTVLPLLALPGRWRFPTAVTFTHAIFFAAVALAAVVTKGADREW